MRAEKSDSPKRQQILTTARELFLKHGFRRVTVEEICREAGASKMTFYKYFRNKVDLAHHMLDRMMADSTARYVSIMKQNIPFTEKVVQSIQLKLEQAEEVGPEFFADLHRDADPEIREHFQRHAQRNIRMIVQDYVEAQRLGEIRPDIKPAFILYILNQMMVMARDEKLSALYESPRDLIMELTRFFFYGVLPRGPVLSAADRKGSEDG